MSPSGLSSLMILTVAVIIIFRFKQDKRYPTLKTSGRLAASELEARQIANDYKLDCLGCSHKILLLKIKGGWEALFSLETDSGPCHICTLYIRRRA